MKRDFDLLKRCKEKVSNNFNRIDRIIKCVFFMIFIFVFTFLVSANHKVYAGENDFQIIKGAALDQTLTPTESDDAGILTSFTIQNGETYTMTFYAPTDTKDLYGNGLTAAVKHEVIFKKINDNNYVYEHRLYKFVKVDDSDPGMWINETADLGDITKYLDNGSVLVKDLDPRITKAMTSEAGDGDYYSFAGFSYAYKFTPEGLVYYYFQVQSGLQNYVYDVNLKLGLPTSTSPGTTLYDIFNLNYATIGDIVNGKEYIHIKTSNVYTYDKIDHKIKKTKLDDAVVENIRITVREENDENARVVKNSINMSNVEYPSKYQVGNDFSYYNAAENVYEIYIALEDIDLGGSRTYYVFMKGATFEETGRQQLAFLDTVVVKGYTNPEFEILRRNFKETYAQIATYRESGTYYLYVNKKAEGVSTWEGYELYATQYVPSDEFIQTIIVPMSIDTTAKYRYKAKVLFVPDLQEIAQDISKESSEFEPRLEYNLTVGVPLRATIDNIIVITEKVSDTETPIVAQYDLSFDTPEELFNIMYSQYQDGNLDKTNLAHNLWFEVYMNTTLTNSTDSSGNTQNYGIADIIYLDYTYKSNIEDSYFTIHTENTKDKYGNYKDCGRLQWGASRIKTTIVLRPSDSEKYDTQSYGFFSYYKSNWDNDDDGVISVPSGGTTSSVQNSIGKYTQYSGQTGPNGYFRVTPSNKIPGNYYIKMRSAFICKYDGSANNVINFSDLSVPVNVFFQTNNDVIPVTDAFNYQTVVNGTGIDLSNEIAGSINGVNGETYHKKMLEPLEKDISEVFYQVFISEDLPSLKATMDDVDNALNKKHDLYIIDGHYDYDNPVVFKSGGPYETDFNINFLRNHCMTNTSKVYHGVYAFYTSDVFDKDLKGYETNNGLVYIKGLDSNTTYYVAIRTAFHIEGETDYRYSDFSKIFNRSTATNPVVPREDEIYPPAPEEYQISADVITDDTKTAIRWKQPENFDMTTYTYAYETIRIADQRLSKENKSNLLTMQELYAKGLSQFKGVRVDKDSETVSDFPSKLFVYHDTGYAPVVEDDLIELSKLGDYIYKIIDNGLKPNRIYYYYTRSVQKMVDNNGKESEIYSDWAELTITTIPIEGIINLREIPIVSRYDVKEFDGYYEKVVAFEAPVGNEIVYGTSQTTPLPKLPEGRDYSFVIKITADEDEYIETKNVLLEAVQKYTPDPQFATYVYRLQKLKSGTKYSVRVAAIDTSITEDNGLNPQSSYSDPITIRTEFNQDDYNRDVKYQEYEKYYNAILDSINNDVGFVTENTNKAYTVKFKEDKMQGELGRINSSTYSLPTTNANSYTYYISNQNIKEMMRLKKGLQLEHNGIIITIPYNFINDEYNSFYGQLLKDCDSVKSEVDDFYLKLWVGFTTPNGYVEGNKTSSDQVQIAMRFIEQNAYNADLDGQLESDIDEYIDSNRESFFERVKVQLNNEIDDAKLIEFVNDEELEIREWIQRLANNYYSNYELDSYSLVDLYNKINLKFKTYDTSSKIYTKKVNDTRWNYQSTINSNGYANGYMDKLGYAVLTTSSDIDVIYGKDDEKNSYYTKSKYDLDTVLIQNGSLNPKTDKISQDLFYDIAYKVMQIDSTNLFELANYKDKIKNMFVFFNNPLTREEVCYGVMQMYNEYSQVNINQVVINNANIAASYNYNSYYRQSILAGYQMGLLTLEDIKNPKGSITTQELLDMIYRIIG